MCHLKVCMVLIFLADVSTILRYCDNYCLQAVGTNISHMPVSFDLLLHILCNVTSTFNSA